MKGLTPEYNFKNIRTLLIEGFSPEELRRFCYSTNEFRPVYDQLAPETGKDSIVDRLIIFAQQRLLFEILLDWAKSNNPRRFELQQPYIQDPTSNELRRKQLEIEHTFERKILSIKQQFDLALETAVRKRDAVLFVNAQREHDAKAELAAKERNLDLFYVDNMDQEMDENRKKELQIEYDFEKKMLILEHEFRFVSDETARSRDARKHFDMKRKYDADIDLAKKERELALSYLKKLNEE